MKCSKYLWENLWKIPWPSEKFREISGKYNKSTQKRPNGMGNARIKEFNKIKYVCADGGFEKHGASGKSRKIIKNSGILGRRELPENLFEFRKI